MWVPKMIMIWVPKMTPNPKQDNHKRLPLHHGDHGGETVIAMSQLQGHAAVFHQGENPGPFLSFQIVLALGS